jgi:hypothetical protein
MMNHNSQVVGRRSGNFNTQMSPVLFPLPLLPLPPKSSSRRARQRYGEALCATTLLNHSVSALNSMYHLSSTPLPASNLCVGLNVSVSKGQHRLLSHLYRVSKKFVVASKLSARTACPSGRQDRSAVSNSSSTCIDNINVRDGVPVHSLIMSCLSSECIESNLTSTTGAASTAPSVSAAMGSHESSFDDCDPTPVSSYFGEDPLLSAIPIVASRVSLPARLSSVPFVSLLPTELSSAYAECNSQLLTPPDEFVLTNSTRLKRPPRFYGERTEYIILLQRMQKLNMIAFTTEPKAVNGLFGVSKDKDEIRLIIDATPANRLFISCPHVQLPDPASLSRLSIDRRRGELWMAKADLESFYHQLVLPKWLQSYFALPGLEFRELLAVGLIAGSGHNRSHTIVYPMCTTLPMGWSHSVFVSQSVHEYILYHIGKLNPLDNIVHIKSPYIDRALHAVYVDDFGVLANTNEECERVLTIALNAYAIAGLSLKMSKLRRSSRDPMQLLGMYINGYDCSIALPNDKLRRMVLLTVDVLRSDLVSGLQIEKLIGLWTWQLLLARPGLSILQHVYRYMNVVGENYQTLWPSVRKELICLISILPLLHVSLLSEWHSRLMATDASETAAGVVSTDLTNTLFDLLWPLSASRRSMYHHINQLVQHRQSTNSITTSNSISTTESVLIQPSVSLVRALHSLVPVHRVTDPNYYLSTVTSPSIEWRTLISSTWRWDEHINTLELQSIILAMRRLLSSPGVPGCRLLLLCDSSVVTYAMMKGRSSSKGLITGMKRIAALLLASGCRMGVVWIPTEVNPADAPSRLQL